MKSSNARNRKALNESVEICTTEEFVRFIDGLPGAQIHLWSETRLRALRVDRILRDSSKRITATTTAEGFRDLVGFLEFNRAPKQSRSIRLLGEHERLTLVFKLLHENAERFELLLDSVQLALHPEGAGATGQPMRGLFPEVLRSIVQLLDLLRLNQTTEEMLTATIDEFGNTKREKRRNEEILLILDHYQEALRELSSENQLVLDRVGLLEQTASILSRGAVDRFAAAFGAIVLDQPTAISPLERLVLEGLSKVIPLTVVCDERVTAVSNLGDLPAPPSLVALEGIGEFASSVKDRIRITVLRGAVTGRQELVSALLDLETSENDPANLQNSLRGLQIWPCTDRREEVRRALRAIALAISEQQIEPAAVQILSFNLDLYSELLVKEAAAIGIPLSLPKGRKLIATIPAGAMLALLAWIREPTLRNAQNLWGSSSARKRATTSAEVEALLLKHKPLIALICKTTQMTPKDLALQATTDAWSIDRLAAFAEWSGVSLEDPEGIELLLLQAFQRRVQGLSLRLTRVTSSAAGAAMNAARDDLPGLLGSLAQFSAEQRSVQELREESDPDRLAYRLRRIFFCTQLSLRELRQRGFNDSREYLVEYVQSRRALTRLLGETRRVLTAVKHQAPELLAAGVANATMELLSSRISAGYFAQELRADGVVASEFLDVRAIRGGAVFLLGVTSDEFPVRRRQGLADGELEERARRLVEANGRRDAAVESFALLAHLLCVVPDIVISYPCESTGDDPEPAAFVSDLQPLVQDRGSEAPTPLLKEPPESWKFIAPVREAHQPSDAVPIAQPMLGGRVSPNFTAYDGEIGPEILDTCAGTELRAVKSSGENLYSVSDLELLADCRHRFFFRRVLGLKEDDRAFGELLMAEVGKVVHAALERFFSVDTLEDLSSPQTFSQAALRMGELAEQCLAESEIDWAGSPFAQVLRERILAGLSAEPAGADGTQRRKKGYLRAALEYQRDRICSLPIALEYRFGLTDAKGPPLSLPSDKGVALLGGVIDRIDAEIDAEGKIQSLFIWDYKTGTPETVSQVEEGKSLQLPLYAAAVANDPRFGKLPLHGACVDLHKPNRSDDEMESLSKGVILEYLAVSKQGSRYVIDESAAERKVERALAISQELDAAVRAGSFHQQAETKACRICEYSKICGRDEVLIALKESVNDGVVLTPNGAGASSKRAPGITTNTPATVEIRTSSEQELASDITTDIALVAGAGSGKTTVLWNRIVRLVLDGASINSIVAITYTKKAAGEIQLRLERSIAAVLRLGRYRGNELSPVDRTRLLQARLDLPNALIGTIHSFASRILGMDELLSAGLAGARVLAQSEQITLQERSIEEILSNRNRSDTLEQRQFLRLLDAGFHPRGVREILRRLLAQPRLVFELSRSLPLAENEDVGLRPSVRERLLQLLRSTPPIGEESNLGREAIALDLAASVAALATAVLKRYSEAKRVLHAADFEDLIVGAHRVLCAQFDGALQERQTVLRERLRRKYRHIMVDEFQDTDPLQWEIVQAILGSGAKDPHIGRESCFIVGDAQQAIYGFRGGDIRTLNRAIENLSKTGRVLALQDNYRSDPEILRFVNGFFNQLFGTEFDPQGLPRIETATPAMPMRPIRSGATGARSRVQLCLTRYEKHRGQRLTKVAEAENVARLVRAELREAGGATTAGPRIAVLTRGVAELSLVADALRVADLPFSISHNQGFFDLDEVISIENLLRTLATPEDQISLVGVLRSPLFGLSDRDLVLLLARLQGDWRNVWNPLFTAPNSGSNNAGFNTAILERACSALSELQLLSNVAPASKVISRAVEVAGLEAAYSALNQAERYRNIERLIDSLEEAELRGEVPGGVRSAAEWFDRQRSERSAAPNANNVEHPVVLMTIHGAKGLEFPTVILPFLKRQSFRGQETRIGEIALGERSQHRLTLLSIRVEDEADDFRRGATRIEKILRERLDALEACEERRVFYVACTRARDRLILSMAEPSNLKAELKKFAKLTAEERAEQVFRAVTPSDWILRLMRPDTLDEPSALILSGSRVEGGEFLLPIEFDR